MYKNISSSLWRIFEIKNGGKKNKSENTAKASQNVGIWGKIFHIYKIIWCQKLLSKIFVQGSRS